MYLHICIVLYCYIKMSAGGAQTHDPGIKSPVTI